MTTVGKGIYKRGNVYWYASKMTNGKRRLVTLQTSDEILAVQRAAIIASTGSLPVVATAHYAHLAPTDHAINAID